jgi:hypothetical protein
MCIKRLAFVCAFSSTSSHASQPFYDSALSESACSSSAFSYVDCIQLDCIPSGRVTFPTTYVAVNSDLETFGMHPRLKNVRLNNARSTPVQCAAHQERMLAQHAVERDANARAMAKSALARWYTQGFDNANRLLPQIQIEANLQVVAAIPNWKDLKRERDGYIMLKSLPAGTAIPVILRKENIRGVRLTYRQLHHQLRCHLELPSNYTLRVCPDRPWYNYMNTGIPVPKREALPVNNACCQHLFGTTLWFYMCTHLTYPDRTQTSA